jgi:hypothetical protein
MLSGTALSGRWPDVVETKFGPGTDFAKQLTRINARLAALETAPLMQFASITGAAGQVVLNIGLIPNSSPAKYGLQFLSPVDASEVMFFGENADGTPALIGDPALTNPVMPQIWNGSNTGLNGSGSLVTIVTHDFTVPAGFTSALVMAVGSTGCTCVAGGGSYVDNGLVIAGNAGHVNAHWVEPGVGNGGTANHAFLATGLSGGGTVNVQIQAAETTPANVAAGTVGGDLSAICLFLR